MSYCGTCGGFYSPACARAGEGTCSPAINPYEQKIVEAHAAVVVASAEIAALQAPMTRGNYEELHKIAERLKHLFD